MRLSMAEQLAQATGRPIPKEPEPRPTKPKQHYHAGSSKLSSVETLASLFMLGQAFSPKLTPVRIDPAVASKAAENLRIGWPQFRDAARDAGLQVIASTHMSTEQIIMVCYQLGITVRHMTKEDAQTA